MSQPTLSPEERLKAARKRFEELKRRNKIPSLGASASKDTSKSESSEGSGHENSQSSEKIVDKNQVDELTKTIEAQKSQIKKLRDTNTDLELENLDLKDKVTELETEIKLLKSKSSKISVDSERSEQVESSKTPAPSNTQAAPPPPSFEPQHNEIQPVASTADYKERVSAWKGWAVDMREWSGCQGPQVII